MTGARSIVLLALLALAAAVISLAAGPAPDIALWSGGAAALTAGTIAILLLTGRVRRTPLRPAPVDAEILVTLRDALHAGPLGRERIVAAVRSLERSLGVADRPLDDPEEEARLLTLPPERFHAWLSGELDRMERDS